MLDFYTCRQQSSVFGNRVHAKVKNVGTIHCVTCNWFQAVILFAPLIFPVWKYRWKWTVAGGCFFRRRRERTPCRPWLREFGATGSRQWWGTCGPLPHRMWPGQRTLLLARFTIHWLHCSFIFRQTLLLALVTLQIHLQLFHPFDHYLFCPLTVILPFSWVNVEEKTLKKWTE